MTKKKWFVGGGVVAGAAIAVVIFLLLAPTSVAPAEPAPQTALASTQTIRQSITGKGAVEAASRATAAFQEGGKITSIAVTVGQAVTAGQALATIDTAPADRALAKARDARWSAGSAFDSANAQISLAQNAAAAARATLAAAPADDPNLAALTGAVRDADAQITTANGALVQAKIQVADADREVAAAEAARAATTLTAPIAGVVVAINGTVGSLAGGGGSVAETPAAASAGLIQIADTSSLIVTAAIAEADISSVAAGQVAVVTLPSQPNAVITGKVTTVSPTPTSADGVVKFPVTVQLTDVPAGVRLGLTALVSITTQEAKDVLTVPIDAVTLSSLTEGTVELVNKKNPKKTKIVEVTVGLVGTELIEIRSGLKAGDSVILPRQLSPADGGGGSFEGGLGAPTGVVGTSSESGL